jgi:hypothetical protein
MPRYDEAQTVPSPEGSVRDLLATTDNLIASLEESIGATEARLFGDRPAEVAKGSGGDVSIPPVQRWIEHINKRLSALTELSNGIRNRL